MALQYVSGAYRACLALKICDCSVLGPHSACALRLWDKRCAMWCIWCPEERCPEEQCPEEGCPEVRRPKGQCPEEQN